ncbi:MAG: GNAT family N-acetyltransferase [Anaerolineae bacterium]|nr:GNAT family N-acetyltransferase [Anaerolineae bacterium]
MEEMIIRLATFDDVPQLSILAGQLGYASTEEEVGCRLAELIQQSNDAVWVAARPDSNVVGWIHIALQRSLLHEPVLMVEGLIINQSYRGMGIGRRLLTHAEQWGEARGCEAICVKSNIIRAEAHKFYEHLGYQNVKTQCVFYKSLEHVDLIVSDSSNEIKIVPDRDATPPLP